MIEELNLEVKTHLAPSPVHGIGLLSLRDISKGEKLYCVFNPHPMYEIPYDQLTELRPEIRSIIVGRYPEVISGGKFLSPNDDQVLTSFMNHSSDPNYDPLTDTALCDIPAFTEVTENYRRVARHTEIYPFLSLI